MSPSKVEKVKEDPINKLIHLRVNNETIEKLDYVSAKTGKSKSEVIRNGIDLQYKKLKKKSNHPTYHSKLITLTTRKRSVCKL